MEDNTLICLYHGFINRIKIIIPTRDYSTTVEITELDKIIHYINIYKINKVILSGLPMVTQQIKYLIENTYPEIKIEIGEI